MTWATIAAAREILAWLDGHWDVTDELVHAYLLAKAAGTVV